MGKALVTGGAGFIGSNVVGLLAAEGYDVVVLDSLVTGYEKNLAGLGGVRLVRGDVRDAGLVASLAEGAEVVFHLAASVGNTRSIESPFEDSEVNVLGTLAVLEAARRAGARKVVYSSSAAIFGELRRLPIDEEHPAEPDSPYGVSKLAGEKHCLAYSRLHGLEAVCLRYFNVYGVGQRYDAYGNVIPIFVRRLLRGEPLTVYGDGDQTRDFVNVSDVARANLLAARAAGVSGAFNIASGESLTVNRLVAMLREASGRDVEVDHAPDRRGDVRHSRADISRARETLGYAPASAMAEGLGEYLEWAGGELA
jgi:UDP-glucose 4-epimerase